MKVVFDIECNALYDPTEIWLIVCKDLETCHKHIFREVTKDASEAERFRQFADGVNYWIGHNSLGYDIPILNRLLGLSISGVYPLGTDTLILSKLIDYPRDSHSIEDYGLEFGIPKGDFKDFSKYSKEMEEYCVRDVEICERIYRKYLKYLNNPIHTPSLVLEHQFQLVVNDLHSNGFGFDSRKAGSLLQKVEEELAILDKDILTAFPPRLKLIREIHPKETKHGTLSKSDFRWLGNGGDLSDFNGGPFCRCAYSDFNPSSHKQIVAVLNEAGWQPVDKTKAHIEAERDYNRLKRQRQRSNELDIALKECIMSLDKLRITGFKVNENNINTLPPTANSAARTLAKRILYEARRRTLTEWLELVDPVTERVYGHFQGIGAWTHRMSHQKPNMANITNEFDTNNNIKLLGKELRQCWRAPKGRLLVGVDAEGIQLRIFAHLINDLEFTEALVKGRKDDKTDPHSLNQRILGSVCKSRQAAKRFIYALLLGAGLGKLSEILGCSDAEAKEALTRLMERYAGWALLKEEVFPRDAKRGYFTGLDGRKVRILGETEGTRRHLAMSGYLQNGEKVVMARATVKFLPELHHYDSFLVDLVHDEWQNECPNNYDICEAVAKLECKALEDVGVELGLNCPLAGSYMNDHGQPTFGTTWFMTH